MWFLFLIFTGTIVANDLPSLRNQAKEQQDWINERIGTILPDLMQEFKVDAWILSQREYAEDTVWRSFAPPTSFNARRRTVNIFILEENMTISTFTIVGFEEIWEKVKKIIEDANPTVIALNIDKIFAFSDGLHAGEYEALSAGLGDKIMENVRMIPELAINFIQLRPSSTTSTMLMRYRQLQEIVWSLLKRAFSEEVISPTETTVGDVSWWLREAVAAEGLQVSFQPSIALRRQGISSILTDEDEVIFPGDHLWSDFGIIGMNLWTDTQHVGYVLKPEEVAVPTGLKNCLSTSNILQDIMLKEIRPGRTGNEVLKAINESMSEANIDGRIYSHPIGDFMHSAGPAIGLFDHKNWAVPVRGDLVVRANSWFSIELSANVAIPEWGGQVIDCRQEEDAYVDSDGLTHFVYGRQTNYHLVDWWKNTNLTKG